MKRIAIGLAIASLLASCDTSLTTPDGTAEAVIEAFLFAGEPVTDVRITSTVELGGTDTVGVAINDADVVLIKGGQRYELTLGAENDGYYRYTGSDLAVNEGDVFDLEVSYAGGVATARTVVPSRPDTLTLSADSLVIPSFGFGGFDPAIFNTRLIARWPNPSGNLFYVTIEVVDDPPTEIGGRAQGGFRRFIFPPVAADSFAVSPFSLAYYGLHEVRVYHVNNEYAALYESRLQDSRDLNEPATNIRNGLGVFSAFSSRTVFFRALPAQ